MQIVKKYVNIESKFPMLPNILLDSIQSEFLEIQKLDKRCLEHNEVIKTVPELLNADYVIFSKYIKKAEHKYEKFVFVDEQGKMITNLSGQDMELYGLLEAKCGLNLTPEYERSHVS